MRNPAQLIVPPRLKVGFNERSDTYTGKLAFVTYRDAQGALHQERAWDKWRKHHIEPVEHPNEPTEGFVLNKNVGGARRSWSHFARDEHIRVYDPRDWEFEISVPNLLYILQERPCRPGKELGGKFLYAWDKNRVILLPANSPDCATSLVFTSLQDKHIGPADLVPGRTYLTKTQEHWVYLGRFDFFYCLGSCWRTRSDRDKGRCKKLVFAQVGDGGWKVIYQKDSKSLAVLVSDVPPDNFPELVELHTRSARGSKIRELIIRDVDSTERGWRDWFMELEPGVVARAHSIHQYGQWQRTVLQNTYEVQNGILRWVSLGGDPRNTLYACRPGYEEYKYGQSRPVESPNPWREPPSNELRAVLECGAEVPVDSYILRKE